VKMATLVVTDVRSGKQATAEFPFGEVAVGSDGSNDIVLDFPGIAEHHCEIRYSSDRCAVRDCDSVGGTFLGGRKVKGEVAWPSGEELRLGGCTLKLEGAAQPPVEAGAVPYKAKIREYLVDHPEVKRLIHTSAGNDELSAVLKRLIREAMVEAKVSRPPGVTEAGLVKEMTDEILGLGPLEDLMRDDSVQEIMVNRWNQILVERAGKGIERLRRSFLDEDHLIETVRRILAPLGRHLNESSPLVDARLKEGTRVNAVIPPISVGGCVMTIRKFAREPFTLEKLTQLGSITSPVAEMLRYAVRSRLNMVISGGTGCGKTCFLNALGEVVPERERLVIIEDTHELRFNHPNMVYLEGRPANLEGKGAIHIRQLVINALRMRPDRIIVGECRGDEAFDMLQAMNTGHLGSMTTVHANSPRDAVLRIENMTLMAGYDLPAAAIRKQVVSAVNLVIQVSRWGSKGERKVSCISEITGIEGAVVTMQDLYRVDENGKLASVGTVPRFLQTIGQKERSQWIQAFGIGA